MSKVYFEQVIENYIASGSRSCRNNLFCFVPVFNADKKNRKKSQMSFYFFSSYAILFEVLEITPLFMKFLTFSSRNTEIFQKILTKPSIKANFCLALFSVGRICLFSASRFPWISQPMCGVEVFKGS